MRVQRARRRASLVNDGAELVGQAGRLQRSLPGVRMNDVELSALSTRVRRKLGLVDRHRDAPDVAHACQEEAAEAYPDDRGRYRYLVPPPAVG